MNKTIKAHDFAEVYKWLGINLDKLGCVMLDLEPQTFGGSTWLAQDGQSSYFDGFPWRYSTNKERFWIDGLVWNKVPHVTLLYGLLQEAKNYQPHIEKILEDWDLDTVTIKEFGYFDSPYPDEEYYCIVAHLEITPELLEGHERLCMLPHIKTFPSYKAHMTVGYIEKREDIRDDFIQKLNSDFSGKQIKVTGINYGGNQ